MSTKDHFLNIKNFFLNGQTNLKDIISKETYSEPARKNYDTKKTGVQDNDNTWSLD